MKESFKAFLVYLASGYFFIVGTIIMQIGGVLPFLISSILYFIGYILISKYKRMS